MNIVYAGTRNLYPQMLPSIKSLLEHNKVDMIYILAEDDELPFEIRAPHKVINVSGQTAFRPGGPNWNSQFTYMAMCRLLYVDLMPECDKVIQLDVDTIVCGSLEPLWNIDLSDWWVYACPEYFANYKPFQMQYFNVGVCVFNLHQLRKDRIVPLMIRDLNLNKYMCLEQDMYNKYGVPLGKIRPIPIQYNESFCCGQTENPIVVHYAGFPDWFTNPNLPRREYLEKYL